MAESVLCLGSWLLKNKRQPLDMKINAINAGPCSLMAPLDPPVMIIELLAPSPCSLVRELMFL